MEISAAILDAISNRVPDYIMFVGLVACVVLLARAMNNLSGQMREQQAMLSSSNSEWRGAQMSMNTQFAQLQIEMARSTPTRAEVQEAIKASSDNTDRMFLQIQQEMRWLRDTLSKKGAP